MSDGFEFKVCLFEHLKCWILSWVIELNLVLARSFTRDRFEVSNMKNGFFHKNPEDLYHSKKNHFLLCLPNCLWREPTLTQNEEGNEDGLKNNNNNNNNNNRRASKLNNNKSNKFNLSKQHQQQIQVKKE
ncbi:hypothetical protein JHK87_040587 [Glycine soja]|nr:hypothetical protein JHK87_040587 [Glycine soja]